MTDCSCGLRKKIKNRIKELEKFMNPKPNGVMLMEYHLEDKIEELKDLLK